MFCFFCFQFVTSRKKRQHVFQNSPVGVNLFHTWYNLKEHFTIRKTNILGFSSASPCEGKCNKHKGALTNMDGSKCYCDDSCWMKYNDCCGNFHQECRAGNIFFHLDQCNIAINDARRLVFLPLKGTGNSKHLTEL